MDGQRSPRRAGNWHISSPTQRLLTATFILLVIAVLIFAIAGG